MDKSHVINALDPHILCKEYKAGDGYIILENKLYDIFKLHKTAVLLWYLGDFYTNVLNNVDNTGQEEVPKEELIEKYIQKITE